MSHPTAPPPLLAPGARRVWSVVIVLMFGLQISLIARTHVTGDDRFGFSMFAEHIAYHIDYQWVYADGEAESFETPETHFRGWGKKINGKGRRETILGRGATRASRPPPGTRRACGR